MKKPSTPKYQSIAFPLIAISLHLLPSLMFYIGGRKLVSAPMILLTIMLSIGGIMMGFISLGEGKEKIGIIGMIIAIAAIALPLGLIHILVYSLSQDYQGFIGSLLAGVFIYTASENSPQNEDTVATDAFVPVVIPMDNFNNIMHNPSNTVLLADSIK